MKCEKHSLKPLENHIFFVVEVLLVSIFFFISFSLSKAEQIIPNERLVSWTPGEDVGVPGGIPIGRTKCDTSACNDLENASSSYKDGSSDASSLMQSAIDSALANTYVYIPSGTWKIGTSLNIGGSKNNISIKGDGMDATVLDCRVNFCLVVGSQSGFGKKHIMAGDLAKGSGQVSLDDTSDFNVEQIVQIVANDDLKLPVVSVEGFRNITREQSTRITNKTDKILNFFPALYEDLTKLGGSISASKQQLDGVGVEDLTVDGSKGSVVFGIWFVQTYASWIKNVKVAHSSNYSVYFLDSLNCEMRHSYLDELNHSGSNGAGLLMDSTAGCLIEDNIIRESFPDIELNKGSAGNVFAYNFINNQNGLIGIDTNHSPHNSFNLFEGNITHNLMSDGYFGSDSEETVYRNWLTGLGQGDHATQTYCLSLKRFSRNFSIVGNILGNASSTGNCDNYGQPNIGNTSSEGTVEPSLGRWWSDMDSNGNTTIAGTLTQSTSSSNGQITLDSGFLREGQTPSLYWNSHANHADVLVGSVNGNVVDVDSSAFGQNLPPLKTNLEIWPGPGGFQELDLDVASSTLLFANYRVGQGGILPVESTTSKLPSSLFRSAKPDFFGSLAWPPFDPYNPNQSYDAIPASYRFFHGKDPKQDIVIKLTEVTPISASTTNQTPSYVFNSTESGTINYSGSCSSVTKEAQKGDNSIILNSLPKGFYSDCSIIVTDSSGDKSLPLLITPFDVIVTDNSSSGGGGSGGGGSSYSLSNVSSGAGSPSFIVTSDYIQTASSTQKASSVNPVVVKFQFSNDMALGSEGEDVRMLQKFLNYQGFNIASAGPGSLQNETIFFGPLTRDALIRFQISKGIFPAQGYFGYVTRNFINSILPPNSLSQQGSGEISTSTVKNKFIRNLRLGMSGEDVRMLQRFLNDNGFIVAINNSGSPGLETEYFGMATQTALIKFQEANGIFPAQGYFGPITQLKVEELSSNRAER